MLESNVLQSRVLRIVISVVIGFAVYVVLALVGVLLGGIGVVEFWIIFAPSCTAAFIGYRRLTRRALQEWRAA